MERIDEDEVGAHGAEERAHLLQVGRVPDAPRPAGTHRVELGRHPPPGHAALRRGGQALGDDDEGSAVDFGGTVVEGDAGSEHVVPERHPRGDDEGSLARENPGDLARRGEVLSLGERPGSPVLQFDLDRHTRPVGEVDGHSGFAVVPDDRAGRKGLPPGPHTGLLERAAGGRLVRRVDSQGCEDPDEREVGDHHLVAVEPPVFSGDAPRIGEFAQQRALRGILLHSAS